MRLFLEYKRLPDLHWRHCRIFNPHCNLLLRRLSSILQPEKTVLDHFETIVTPIFDGVYQMVQENKNLIQQRDLLLPRLMSGKLEV